MRPFSQIAIDALSLVAVFVIGSLFAFAFTQAGYHAEAISGGKPLPAITQWLISHDYVISLLTFLPWFGLVGVPLFTIDASEKYWDPLAFVFRYLVFLSAELLLCFMLLVALMTPFIPYYAVMAPPGCDAGELCTQLLTLALAGLVVMGAIFRAMQIRKDRRTVGESPRHAPDGAESKTE